MPLRLQLSVARKVGQPDYGSVQALCQIDMELSNDALDDQERLQSHVRRAYNECATAVADELARQTDSPIAAKRNGHPNGHDSNGNGNGHRGPSNGNGRKATASQVRAIHALANKNRINIGSRLLESHGCDRPDDLSIQQASEVIDELKGSANGIGGKR